MNHQLIKMLADSTAALKNLVESSNAKINGDVIIHRMVEQQEKITVRIQEMVEEEVGGISPPPY